MSEICREKVTIHSPSTLHSQSRTLPRTFSPLRAKIAHLVEVPASQSDLENSISRLRASTTHLIEFSKSAVNSNGKSKYLKKAGLTAVCEFAKLRKLRSI